jgi:phenylpropionate dioxygenase-like ring-hydroxylating dioxygenase large terminal subunit
MNPNPLNYALWMLRVPKNFHAIFVPFSRVSDVHPACRCSIVRISTFWFFDDRFSRVTFWHQPGRNFDREYVCRVIDDPILVHDWHAVAWVSQLRESEPTAARLLEHDLVLWRSHEGLHAWQDLCVHRGARLSAGRVNNSHLACPYHGWEYDTSGQCVRIPAHPDRPPPARARATVYAVQEKYDLVWVCLGKPQREVPAFAEWNDRSFVKVAAGPYLYRAHGPRVVENLLDVAHFPFVHAGYLGDPAEAEIGDYEVEASEMGIVAKDIPVWQPDPDGTGRPARVLYTYEVSRPFIASFTKIHGQNRFSMFACVTPAGERESLAWLIMALNYAHDVPAEELRRFQDVVSRQDIPVVESQRPELLPLDLQAELHLRSDRMAIAYRQWLKKLGLRYGTA